MHLRRLVKPPLPVPVHYGAPRELKDGLHAARVLQDLLEGFKLAPLRLAGCRLELSLFPDEEEILLEPERQVRVVSVLKAALTIINLEMLDTPLSDPEVLGSGNE